MIRISKQGKYILHMNFIPGILYTIWEIPRGIKQQRINFIIVYLLLSWKTKWIYYVDVNCKLNFYSRFLYFLSPESVLAYHLILALCLHRAIVVSVPIRLIIDCKYNHLCEIVYLFYLCFATLSFQRWTPTKINNESWYHCL